MTSTSLGEQPPHEQLKLPVQSQEAQEPARQIRPASDHLGNKILVAPFIFPGKPYEYKVIALRECPTPESLQLCDTPDQAAAYWRLHLPGHPYFNPEVECFAVLLRNTRRRVKGHHLVSIGTLDTILVHPREVFRFIREVCTWSGEGIGA
jgi:hypothetical protein